MAGSLKSAKTLTALLLLRSRMRIRYTQNLPSLRKRMSAREALRRLRRTAA